MLLPTLEAKRRDYNLFVHNISLSISKKEYYTHRIVFQPINLERKVFFSPLKQYDPRKIEVSRTATNFENVIITNTQNMIMLYLKMT